MILLKITVRIIVDYPVEPPIAVVYRANRRENQTVFTL
jgi:precorrin-4 methylase